MKANILDISQKDIFNRFVSDHPTGDILQTWQWGDLKSRSGWRPIRLAFEEDGQTVATASILLRNLPGLNRTIAYIPRGPVMDFSNDELCSRVSSELRDIAVNNRAILLKIDPPVETDDRTSESNIIANGFKKLDLAGFGGTQPKCVMQLDLDKDEDALLASFKSKWRYNIRLASKKGVTVNTDCTSDYLPVFYDILRTTCSRDNFLVRGYSYFEDMWECMQQDGLMRLALTYYEGQAIAGAIVHQIGDRAWYVYGASSNEHRNVMPNHLMQWELIKQSKSLGCKWYDFRGVSCKREETENDPLYGLNRFKEGFSPRFVEYIGEFDMVLSPTLYWLWTFAKPKVQDIIKRKKKAADSPQVAEI